MPCDVDSVELVIGDGKYKNHQLMEFILQKQVMPGFMYFSFKINLS